MARHGYFARPAPKTSRRAELRAAGDLERSVEGLRKVALARRAPWRARATWRWSSRVVPAKSPRRSPRSAKGPRVRRAGAGDCRASSSRRASRRSTRRRVVKDEKKGDFYVARIDKPGRAAKEIVAEVVPAVAAKFPWPKSMRWGSGRDHAGCGRCIRSCCLLDGKVVPFEIAGVESGKDDARASLPRQRAVRGEGLRPTTPRRSRAHKVMLDPAERARR